MEQMSDGSDVKNFRLETEKRTAESYMALQKMKKCTLWKGRPPPKWKKLRIKKEPACRITGSNLGKEGTRNFQMIVLTDVIEKKYLDDRDNLDLMLAD
jgi:hypothetical protein